MLLAAVVLAACRSAPEDALIPLGYAGKVDDARSSLQSNWEGLIQPTFAFVEVRCRVDGGMMIVFRQGGPGSGAFAYAMQGPQAVDGPDGWGGGFGVEDLAADEEIAFFFRESPERSCPPLVG
jgi:hypothetical protein